MVGKNGLHLNIPDTENALDYQLAFDVMAFFQLTQAEARHIYDEVLNAVKKWQQVAQRLGISRAEQLMKQEAFNL